MTDYMVIGNNINKENVKKLVEAIRSKGKTCYDFSDKAAFPATPDASPEDQMEALESNPDFLNDPLHKSHYDRDMEGLLNAETIVFLLPGGISAHIEAGVAYGKGKKVILIGEPEKAETLYYIFDEHYKDTKSFLESVK